MIPTQLDRVVYTGDGVTTGFSFAAVVLKDTDVVVKEVVIATGVSTTLSLGGYYSIEGTPDAVGRYTNGITVRAAVAPAATVQWVIYQDPSVTQSVDLTDNGLLSVESQVELPLDRLTVIAQRTRSLVTRTLSQPDSDPSNIATIPNKVDRASKFLAFDASGDPIASAGGISSSVPVSAFMETVLDDADAVTARGTLKVGAADSAVRGLNGTRDTGDANVLTMSMDAVTLVKWVGLTPSEFVTLTNLAGELTNLSVDASIAGPVAGGRDSAGAFSNPSAVSIYAIWNGTAVALIATTNIRLNGPFLPSGYTHYAYLTTVMYTTQFADVRCVGKTVYIPAASVASLTATSNTFVNLSTFASANVPSTFAKAILGDIQFTGTSTAGGTLDMTFSLKSGSSSNPVPACNFRLFQAGINSTSQVASWPFRLALWTSGFVYQNSITSGTSPAGTVSVKGYEVLNGDH